ncbi:MAG: hypothetical protein O3C21_13360, partial [Verrucomicrobia bacterium]|nr:hypothetical protein [Verrucomicrobiota bacterium]
MTEDAFERKLAEQEMAKLPAKWRGEVLANAAAKHSESDLGSTAPARKSAGFRLVSTLMGSKFFTIALTGIGLMVSLGAIVAAYEGSRSKSRMEKLTAMLKADGIELTIESILPEPVPDDQNFMATPSLHGIEIPEAMDPEGIYAAKRARLESVPRMHFDDERDFAELTYDADPATGVDA